MAIETPYHRRLLQEMASTVVLVQKSMRELMIMLLLLPLLVMLIIMRHSERCICACVQSLGGSAQLGVVSAGLLLDKGIKIPLC